MTQFTVVCKNLTKSYAQTAVLQNVSFQVKAGEIVALLGASGCGKTTTLRLIAGFEMLEAGQIEIDGQLVANGRLHIPPEKRRVGMVFQDYAIFPHLSVAQNVAFGLPRGKSSLRQAREMLAFVGLPDLGDKMPQELSGGQQQRVALARALAPAPAVLLLDEPFSNLDAGLRMTVRRDVKQLLKQSGTTAVFVTHDQEEALFLADQVAVMHQGQVEQIGTPEMLFHEPQTRFVAEFMGQTDFVAGEVTNDGIVTALGLLPQPVQVPAGTQVDIAVRPDDLTMTPAAAGNGRILMRHFVGIAYIYEVRLADGTLLRCWQPHTRTFDPGTRVTLALQPNHPLACFARNKRV